MARYDAVNEGLNDWYLQNQYPINQPTTTPNNLADTQNVSTYGTYQDGLARQQAFRQAEAPQNIVKNIQTDTAWNIRNGTAPWQLQSLESTAQNYPLTQTGTAGGGAGLPPTRGVTTYNGYPVEGNPPGVQGAPEMKLPAVRQGTGIAEVQPGEIYMGNAQRIPNASNGGGLPPEAPSATTAGKAPISTSLPRAVAGGIAQAGAGYLADQLLASDLTNQTGSGNNSTARALLQTASLPFVAAYDTLGVDPNYTATKGLLKDIVQNGGDNTQGVTNPKKFEARQAVGLPALAELDTGDGRDSWDSKVQENDTERAKALNEWKTNTGRFAPDPAKTQAEDIKSWYAQDNYAKPVLPAVNEKMPRSGTGVAEFKDKQGNVISRYEVMGDQVRKFNGQGQMQPMKGGAGGSVSYYNPDDYLKGIQAAAMGDTRKAMNQSIDDTARYVQNARAQGRDIMMSDSPEQLNMLPDIAANRLGNRYNLENQMRGLADTWSKQGFEEAGSLINGLPNAVDQYRVAQGLAPVIWNAQATAAGKTADANRELKKIALQSKLRDPLHGMDDNDKQVSGLIYQSLMNPETSKQGFAMLYDPKTPPRARDYILRILNNKSRTPTPEDYAQAAMFATQ